ncbi:MAG: hypothetical protein A3G33_09020 [Omnitrophica bacterium RIFCSPLOWO2_12_FULL_44_17]|uniref:ABC transporter permease n=1 Tax=Candidatus Danuiimicrobium aquiferis TaxID=1801832 RepID=A0A1G1L062_9BACT|nr:MAG: hypothetical protein A3B72_00110 [Omnitrophica bacterium RIFCSPHIGHO2_02_FULL_45_28]OGW91613.1 MAG: hypothetical protein A3E74_05125 [Omnitrophica bacterium RIFCSPHIGHO2_12_FULL_44_12]OGW98536.1 MAG: hypothetical protein A3G33_09020 [Omnitrophica bacterium RIFCSPLOWO2_12_FULL_44_17]OGX05087.1 MAG: hypothetical protein A3J12_08900 [Omnitrophica bacterium RIFCSPLOWO2_02_FULL_44_11]
MANVQKWLENFGDAFLGFLEDTGGIVVLFWKTIVMTVSKTPRWYSTLEQSFKIGVLSLPLVMLTSLFTGMVLCLQSAYQLRIFAAEQFTADLVALSVTRELGPVLTAMMVAGRVGASMAAELGTMKVTEQIDALDSLATNPIHFLVVPRFIATVSMLFLLTIYADLIGMLGGFLVAVFKLGISQYIYINRSFSALVMKDIYTGLIKSVVFGVIISIVGCYYGFKARGGAEGVGHATTMAVVVSFILIIVFDTFFTALFYFVF